MTEFNVGDIVKSYRIQNCKGLVGIVVSVDPSSTFAPIKVEWLNPHNPRLNYLRRAEYEGHFCAANLRKVQ
jgi:hypothetical protein